jgi:hypothetical protein
MVANVYHSALEDVAGRMGYPACEKGTLTKLDRHLKAVGLRREAGGRYFDCTRLRAEVAAFMSGEGVDVDPLRADPAHPCPPSIDNGSARQSLAVFGQRLGYTRDYLRCHGREIQALGYIAKVLRIAGIEPAVVKYSGRNLYDHCPAVDDAIRTAMDHLAVPRPPAPQEPLEQPAADLLDPLDPARMYRLLVRLGNEKLPASSVMLLCHMAANPGEHYSTVKAGEVLGSTQATGSKALKALRVAGYAYDSKVTAKGLALFT